MARTDNEEKKTIYKKLTQHLLFNIYEISSDIDVFVAFETMNNRGKPLSYLELLKNRLIYLSTKFDVDPLEKEKLRRSVNETWKSMYHYLGKNKNKPLDDDMFLSNHFAIYFEKDSIDDDELLSPRELLLRRRMRNLYSTYLLEKKFTVKSINSSKGGILSGSEHAEDSDKNYPQSESLTLNEVYDYVRSLKESVELWYKILNPDDSNFSDEEKIWLNKLVRISYKDVFPSAPLVMVFFQKESSKNERLRLLKVLEGIHFLNLLSGESSYASQLFLYLDIFPDFKNLAEKLSKNKTSPKKVLKELEDIRNKVSSNQDFKKSFVKIDNFYKWPGIRYFLYEYDLYLQQASKTKREKLNWDEFGTGCLKGDGV